VSAQSRSRRASPPYPPVPDAYPGSEIVHPTPPPPPPPRRGFEILDSPLRLARRPPQALCGIELRSPRPFTFSGFVDFNTGYIERLRERGILVGDVNSVARTNVAPEVTPPAEVALYGFSYTAPAA